MSDPLVLTFMASQARPAAKAQHSPAVALFESQLFMAWSDQSTGQICYSWGSTQNANTKFDISGTPGVAVLKNKIIMVWRGAGDGSQHIYFASFDGKSWSNSAQCNKQYSASESPALILLSNGLLCMAWRGASDSNIYLADSDGTHWSSYQKVSCNCDSSPALANYQTSLYLAWQDKGVVQCSTGSINTAPVRWTPMSPPASLTIAGSPQLVYLDKPYLIVCGNDQNGLESDCFYATGYFKKDWSLPSLVSVADTAGNAAVFRQDAENFLLGWRDGRTTTQLRVCRGAVRPFAGWMSKYGSKLASKTLKQMCLPGAHDAAMSTATNCEGLGSPCNTLTQAYGMTALLQAGVRYFDLRPTWDDSGALRCGHFGYFLGTLNGCCSILLSDLLDEVAAFLDYYDEELVVLKFSHYLDVNRNQHQLYEITNLVQNKLSSYLFVNKTGKRLADIPFSTLTAEGATVLAVFTSKTDTAISGCYSYGDYDPNAKSPQKQDLLVYDVFSDTSNLLTMANDQVAKLQNPANHGGDLFLLSWTLTLGWTTAPVGYCVWDLALTANDALDSYILERFYSSTMPNVLYVDFANGWCADYCLFLMGLYGSD